MHHTGFPPKKDTKKKGEFSLTVPDEAGIIEAHLKFAAQTTTKPRGGKKNQQNEIGRGMAVSRISGGENIPAHSMEPTNLTSPPGGGGGRG